MSFARKLSLEYRCSEKVPGKLERNSVPKTASMEVTMSAYIRAARISAVLLVLIVSVPPALAAAGSEDKPNIVLVLMDNFGYGEPGVYGGGEIRGAPTPNIDSIAHEGFQLTNYNVDAECTPSRASLMTGRYAIRTRLRKDAPAQDPWYGLNLSEYTLEPDSCMSCPPGVDRG